MGHQRAFAMLVMGRAVNADEAREAGFVNAVVAPGHTEVEALKVAREIAALPPEAVALSRKLLKPAREDVLRRVEEETQLFGQRLKSDEARNAFAAFFARKKKA
jgi:enoyl-CoA hydratase/carnithine racemase